MTLLLVAAGVFVVLLLAVLLVVHAQARWQSGTKALCAAQKRARVPVRPQRVDFGELHGLPAPVERYFRTVLTEGQPLVSAVQIEQTGTFNTRVGTSRGDEHGEKSWKPFKAKQWVTTQRPSFIWDARIYMAPRIAAFVWDAYLAGEGLLVGKLLGLIKMMAESRTPELAKGELMRFFGEAALYPTALLPSQGVRWEAVDDRSAKATIRDGEISVTALFRFDQEGFIESFLMDRGRAVAGRTLQTPWEGHFRSYEHRDWMRIPIEGEVRWVLPDGPHPYWRGRTTKIEYEFAK